MSEITRFNNDVRENQEMLDALKEIGNDLEQVIAYANSKGYALTVEELEAKAKQEGELSEEQLNNVAGGLSAVITGIADVTAVLIL